MSEQSVDTRIAVLESELSNIKSGIKDISWIKTVLVGLSIAAAILLSSGFYFGKLLITLDEKIKSMQPRIEKMEKITSGFENASQYYLTHFEEDAGTIVTSKKDECLQLIDQHISHNASIFMPLKKMELETLYVAETDGFAIVNVGGHGGATADFWVNRDVENVDIMRERHGSSVPRATVTGFETEFIPVMRGMNYFAKRREESQGTADLYWMPVVLHYK